MWELELSQKHQLQPTSPDFIVVAVVECLKSYRPASLIKRKVVPC